MQLPSGLLKVGWSTNLPQRLRDLGYRFEARLRLLATAKVRSRRHETRLHHAIEDGAANSMDRAWMADDGPEHHCYELYFPTRRILKIIRAMRRNARALI